MKIPITSLGGDKRESARAMGFEEELEVRLGLATAEGAVDEPVEECGWDRGEEREERPSGSGGSLGSRVEAKDGDSIVR